MRVRVRGVDDWEQIEHRHQIGSKLIFKFYRKKFAEKFALLQIDICKQILSFVIVDALKNTRKIVLYVAAKEEMERKRGKRSNEGVEGENK